MKMPRMNVYNLAPFDRLARVLDLKPWERRALPKGGSTEPIHMLTF